MYKTYKIIGARVGQKVGRCLVISLICSWKRVPGSSSQCYLRRYLLLIWYG